MSKFGPFSGPDGCCFLLFKLCLVSLNQFLEIIFMGNLIYQEYLVEVVLLLSIHISYSIQLLSFLLYATSQVVSQKFPSMFKVLESLLFCLFVYILYHYCILHSNIYIHFSNFSPFGDLVCGKLFPICVESTIWGYFTPNLVRIFFVSIIHLSSIYICVAP